MMIPLPKLKALIRYFATNTEQRFLGKVKLMKLIYFADFMHVKKYGNPITYDTYVHLEHGPIPSTIKNLVDNVADDVDSAQLADAIKIQRPEGSSMQRIVANRKFTEEDERFFTPTELEIMNSVVARFGGVNTQSIEDESHAETSWKETRLLEEISYVLAAEDPDAEVTGDEIKLAIELAKGVS